MNNTSGLAIVKGSAVNPFANQGTMIGISTSVSTSRDSPKILATQSAQTETFASFALMPEIPEFALLVASIVVAEDVVLAVVELVKRFRGTAPQTN